MIRKSLAVTAVLATLVAPAFADVPDGHGGRTSPHALGAAVLPAAPAHACCNAVAASALRTVASSPAELKALGHLARIARKDDPGSAAPCYKGVAHQPAVYGSPAERKAVGHVAARRAANAAALVTCCDTGRCPMRPKATASR